MSDWISEMANAVEQHEAAQAPPSSETPVPAILIDDAPTELVPKGEGGSGQ